MYSMWFSHFNLSVQLKNLKGKNLGKSVRLTICLDKDTSLILKISFHHDLIWQEKFHLQRIRSTHLKEYCFWH